MEDKSEIRNLTDLIDYAHRAQLLKYDDGRAWYFLTDPDVSLGAVAHATMKGDIPFIEGLVNKGSLKICQSIRDIPGDDFLVIYFDNAYFLMPFNDKNLAPIKKNRS